MSEIAELVTKILELPEVDGLISIDKSFGRAKIHLTASAFKRMFSAYKKQAYSLKDNRLFVFLDGVEVMALESVELSEEVIEVNNANLPE